MESSLSLRNIPPRTVGPEYLVYVNQREFAIAAPSAEHVSILGTDDATTCHILVLRHSGNGVTGLAHLDGTDVRKGVQRMMTKLKHLCHGAPEGRFEAHLVGGFLDERYLSADLTHKVLDALMRLEDEVHLLTACVMDYNDELRGNTHFPVIYGLACELESGAIYPATFPDKGPDTDIRAAGLNVQDAIKDVFDNDLFIVGPYDWRNCTHLTRYINYPDEFFLQCFSTSPEQEPAHFADHLRRALCILRDHPDPGKTLFLDNRPRTFRKLSNGSWAACR